MVSSELYMPYLLFSSVPAPSLRWLCMAGSDVARLIQKESAATGEMKWSLQPVTFTVGISVWSSLGLSENGRVWWSISSKTSSLLLSSDEPKWEHSDGVWLDRDANSPTESLRNLILSLNWLSCSRNIANFSLICISWSSTLITSWELLMLFTRSKTELSGVTCLMSNASALPFFSVFIFNSDSQRSGISPHDRFFLSSARLRLDRLRVNTFNKWSMFAIVILDRLQSLFLKPQCHTHTHKLQIMSWPHALCHDHMYNVLPAMSS